jgi:hypothetical protein
MVSFAAGGIALILVCLALHLTAVSADVGSLMVFFSSWLYLMAIGWTLAYWAEAAESEERKNPF